MPKVKTDTTLEKVNGQTIIRDPDDPRFVTIIPSNLSTDGTADELVAKGPGRFILP